MATIAWSPAQGAAALADLRAMRAASRRARRRQVSLSDRIFPWYLTVLFGAYAAILLDGTRDVRVNGHPVAQTTAGLAARSNVGALVWLAVLGVLAVTAATAVDGGPVALPTEDLRVLLATPVPRTALLRRQLLRSYAKALAAGVVVGLLLLLVEVALLSETAAQCVAAALALPILVALGSVAFGWLVEATRRGRLAGRLLATVATLALLATAGIEAHAVGGHGQLGGWSRLNRITHVPLLRGVVGAAQPGADASRILTTLGLVALIVIAAAAAGWLRVGAVSAEQIATRSGRAVVLRTALLAGMTSSSYVTRSAPARRRRTHRITLWRPRTPTAAVWVKAFLQEQGTPLVARLLLAAVTGAVVDAVVLSDAPLRTFKPALGAGAAIGLLLAGVATRYADPLRIDIELYSPVGGLPVPFVRIASADLGAPALTFTTGALLGALAVPALGVQPWSHVAQLLVFAVLLGPLVAAVGALSASSNVPVALASTGVSLALRMRGVIACIVVLAVVAIGAHPRVAAGHVASASHSADGLVWMLVLTSLVLSWAALSGGKALLRDR